MAKDLGPLSSKMEAAIADAESYIWSFFKRSGELGKRLGEAPLMAAENAARLAGNGAATRPVGTASSRFFDLGKGYDRAITQLNNRTHAFNTQAPDAPTQDSAGKLKP